MFALVCLCDLLSKKNTEYVQTFPVCRRLTISVCCQPVNTCLNINALILVHVGPRIVIGQPSAKDHESIGSPQRQFKQTKKCLKYVSVQCGGAVI